MAFAPSFVLCPLSSVLCPSSAAPHTDQSNRRSLHGHGLEAVARAPSPLRQGRGGLATSYPNGRIPQHKPPITRPTLATLVTGNTCTLATFPSPLHAVALAPARILHHPPETHAFYIGKSHHPPQPRHPHHHRRSHQRNPPRQHPVAQHDPRRKRWLNNPRNHD